MVCLVFKNTIVISQTKDVKIPISAIYNSKIMNSCVNLGYNYQIFNRLDFNLGLIHQIQMDSYFCIPSKKTSYAASKTRIIQP